MGGRRGGRLPLSRPSSGTSTPPSTRRCATRIATTPRPVRAVLPYEPAKGRGQLLPGYVDRLLALCDRFAPGTSELVGDSFALPPPGIEQHFGISYGHIHHVDNTIAFADRMPYATGIDGLYAGSAGCHPAGSVIGAAGVNAARRVLADLDVAAESVPT